MRTEFDMNELNIACRLIMFDLGMENKIDSVQIIPDNDKVKATFEFEYDKNDLNFNVITLPYNIFC